MKIGLFGYGKMGKMIENLAVERGHEISARIDVENKEIDFSSFDIAIDFSTPDSAFQNITSCFQHGIPVISGTTGWLENFDKAVSICNQNNTGFIYASNFSLGVNIFFELNAQLARMMAQLEQYNVSMEEIHHTQKVDAPSGTAITLAEGIMANTPYKSWKLDENGEDIVSIHSKREGSVPGTHIIDYSSEVDSIEIKHTAHNRKGFALGAVLAAEWLIGKKGVYTMKDVLNLS
ncbi:4-hydroxy-tetrahydrodipicolinate reductase [Flagellimonas meridianipacifica]|uniref:4-hydroxy-tetrahydrodipicolinate reductase n=1 Tax=Flagellimonas meridianipacifica TaxID=1080225 RepID=A0A2T0M9S2_9FLAO|nr:4-hydroxy-tetrahydrodipicolinate reductase [Allomuricauda pacifica]PRX54215.1 4-hydroxy-tetrahydrodipicolinate reductase [Allomuricauda pacifica]